MRLKWIRGIGKGNGYTVNGQNVTIKTTYLEKIKSQSSTKLVFEFEDGQTQTFTININIPGTDGILYKKFCGRRSRRLYEKEWKRFYESGKWCHEASGRWRIY